MNTKTYLEYNRYGVFTQDGSYTGSDPKFGETIVHIMQAAQISSLVANHFNNCHHDIIARGSSTPDYPDKELESFLVDKDGYIDVKRFFVAMLLHDIGKEKVPIDILSATGYLSQDAEKVMAGHTKKGAGMIATLIGEHRADENELNKLRRMIAERYPFVTSLSDEDLKAAKYIARYHHETADGSGYEHIKATPLLQIAGLSDAYQATRARRSYHDRNSSETTKKIILSRAEFEADKPSAFDKDITSAFFEDDLMSKINKTFEPVYEYLTTADRINTDTMMAISSFTKDYPGQCRYVDGHGIGYDGMGFIVCGDKVVAFTSEDRLITAITGRETIDGITARVNSCYSMACQREFGLVETEFPYEDYEFLKYSTGKGRHSLKISGELSENASWGDSIEDAIKNLSDLHQIRQASRTAYMMGLKNMGDRLSMAELSLRELLMYRDFTSSKLGDGTERRNLTEERLKDLHEDLTLLAELSASFIISVSEDMPEAEAGRDIFKEVEAYVNEKADTYQSVAKDIMKSDYRKAQGELGRYLNELSVRMPVKIGEESAADGQEEDYEQNIAG